MIYYTSTKFHLPSFFHLGDIGGHFDPPWFLTLQNHVGLLRALLKLETVQKLIVRLFGEGRVQVSIEAS